jgi:hypothetical protein
MVMTDESPLFVLLHSPVVGPGTWAPVAGRLAGLGRAAIVPSLLAVANGAPPYWPRVVDAVIHGLGGSGQERPIILVAHSNAGVFVPAISHALPGQVTSSVFVDATVPNRGGPTPNTGEDFLPFLRGLADPDGRLPRWTDWWEEEDLRALFPDQHTRDLVTAELPRLPLAYCEEQVPVPDGWDDHPCCYLRFSPGYEGEARRAAKQGWPVRSLPGEHLHQLADPGGVASALLELTSNNDP